MLSVYNVVMNRNIQLINIGPIGNGKSFIQVKAFTLLLE